MKCCIESAQSLNTSTVAPTTIKTTRPTKAPPKLKEEEDDNPGKDKVKIFPFLFHITLYQFLFSLRQMSW